MAFCVYSSLCMGFHALSWVPAFGHCFLCVLVPPASASLRGLLYVGLTMCMCVQMIDVDRTEIKLYLNYTTM
jgi:hypothetical protein